MESNNKDSLEDAKIIEASTDFKKIGVERNIYGNRTIKKKRMNLFFFFIIIFIFLAALFGFAVYSWQISAMDLYNDEDIVFEIKEGDLSEEIANTLVESKLIRNRYILKFYLKFHKVNNYTEGKYLANQKKSLKEIVGMIEKGEVYDETVIFQILEGKNLSYIAEQAEELIGFEQKELFDLMEDDEYIDELIENYWFLTEEIKAEEIRYPLEGYLFPDTYHFNKNTDAKLLIETMLDGMEEKLKPYKALYFNADGTEKTKAHEVTVHQILTLASSAELEGNSKENRREIIGVFNNRIKQNISLGSDPTANYAFERPITEELEQRLYDTEHPYNTRGPNMEGKYPPGPICSPSQESIDAAFYPKASDNLFFVSDKNGKIYFTRNNTEHSNKIEELRAAGLWFEYD